MMVVDLLDLVQKIFHLLLVVLEELIFIQIMYQLRSH